MAAPTGTFSSPYAGRLIVTLTSAFSSNTTSNYWFPSRGGGNIALRGYAGPSGTPSYTPTIDKFGTTAILELDYPGGNAAWPVGVEVLEHYFEGSFQAVFMQPIKLTCTLRKKN